jgi:hypothetical protein
MDREVVAPRRLGLLVSYLLLGAVLICGDLALTSAFGSPGAVGHAFAALPFLIASVGLVFAYRGSEAQLFLLAGLAWWFVSISNNFLEFLPFRTAMLDGPILGVVVLLNIACIAFLLRRWRDAAEAP